MQAQGKPCFLPETPSLWCVERCLSPYHSDDWQIWLDDHNASCNEAYGPWWSKCWV